MKQGILLLSFTLGSLLSAGAAKGEGCTKIYTNTQSTEDLYQFKNWQQCLNYALKNPSLGIKWTDDNGTYSLNDSSEIKNLAYKKGGEAPFGQWNTYVSGLDESVKIKLTEIQKGTYNGPNIVTSLSGAELEAFEKNRIAAAAADKLKCENEGKVWANGECKSIKSWQVAKDEIVDHLTRDEKKQAELSQNLERAESVHSGNVEVKTGVSNLIKENKKENKNVFDRISGRAKRDAIKDHDTKVGHNLGLKNTVQEKKDALAKFDKENSTYHDGQGVCSADGTSCSDTRILTDREKLQGELNQAENDYNDDLEKHFNSNENLVKKSSDVAKINTEESGKKLKEAQKKKAKEDQREASAREIMEKNQGGFDGRYGTLHSGISRSASELMVQGMGVLDDMGRSKVVQNSNIQAANLAAQGPTVTSRNMIDSQNKVNEETRLQLDKAKKRANITALSQTLLGAAHLASNSVVKKRAGDAAGKIKADLRALKTREAAAQGNAVALAEIAQERRILNEQLGNVTTNLNGARNAQVMNSLNMGIEAAKSFNKARQFKIERDAVRDQDYSGLQNNQNYNIQLTNEAPPPGAVDTAPTVTALTDGQILNPETDDKAVALEDQPQFNPTDLDTMAGAPPAPGFGEGRTETPQGAPGGGGGGVGGTQAAQDDGGPQAPAKTKDPVVSYAANDPTAAGRGFSGKSGGGSEGVGIDQAFADLLKKLLPAEEGAESRDAGADQVALGDRAPASDQAAVIGRNQNIFEVIHKRYLKKSQEGAVLYNL
jgi:hypothetical protein